MRTRARIESVRGVDICRVDVAKSSVPVRAKMSDKDDVFWVRMNNTTHAWPETPLTSTCATIGTNDSGLARRLAL